MIHVFRIKRVEPLAFHADGADDLLRDHTYQLERSVFLGRDHRDRHRHSFDFTALPSNFTVVFAPLSNSLTIDDGTTSFVVQDVGGSGGADATLGGGNLLSYFTDVAGGAGHDSLLGGLAQIR